MKKKILIFIVILVLLGTSLSYLYIRRDNVKKISILTGNKIDDWKYTSQELDSDFSGIKSTISNFMPESTMDSAGITPSNLSGSASNSNLGFSTGGAKNVENFRENIENGYFPISTDITYNGLFYDYYFNTGSKQKSEELFSPSYSIATSKDPISGELEYYMSVGLNSNIKESDFARKKLNLVVVLDISGSMDSEFNSYYYDGENENKEDEAKSKMQLASESLNILIDQLDEEDRLGIVLFDDTAYVAKEMNLIGNTDVDAIKNHILEISAQGGTNFEAGYTKGTNLFEEIEKTDEYENRIIVITDAMPNYGETSDSGLLKYVEENAKDKIYTTFIGVGVDFNTKLIEKIGTIRGANYYSVNSAEEFKSTMKDEFEFMVTPMVFDLSLNFESEDYEIEAVYGSDASDKSTGNIMHVNTLFPSSSNSNGEVKGGIILLKLSKKSNDNGKISLNVEYTDRNGEEHSNSQEVTYNSSNKEEYDNSGIRKAIVLTRYVNVLKNWILYERSEDDKFIIVPQYGITDCIHTEQEIFKLLGEHERTSVKLSVSKEYKDIFEKVKKYIQNEIKEVDDNSLSQEIDIIDILLEK